jgi:hypothetical protein
LYSRDATTAGQASAYVSAALMRSGATSAGAISAQVTTALGHLNVDSQHGWAHGNPTIEQTVATAIAAGRPVLAYVQQGLRGSGHYLLIVGYGERSGWSYYILNDPRGARGDQGREVLATEFPDHLEGFTWYEAWIIYGLLPATTTTAAAAATTTATPHHPPPSGSTAT